MRIFLRARRASRTVGMLVVLGAVGPLTRTMAVEMAVDQPLVPVVVFFPTAAAALICEALATGSGELEASSPRPTGLLTLGYAVGSGVIAALLLAPAMGAGDGVRGVPAMVRNTRGQLGAGLLGTAVLGASRGWLLPLGIGIPLVVVEGATRSGAWWAWLTAGDGAPASWVVAGVLLVAGAAAATAAAPLRR